jgi:hypothetical protein
MSVVSLTLGEFEQLVLLTLVRLGPPRRVQSARGHDRRHRAPARDAVMTRCRPRNNTDEHGRKRNLSVSVGTDFGVYASLDGGKARHRMRNAKMTNPVHDMHAHPREQELIVGTHGRGIFIADISGLQALTPDVLGSDAHLVPIVPTVPFESEMRPVTGSLERLRSAPSRAPHVQVGPGRFRLVALEASEGSAFVPCTDGPFRWRASGWRRCRRRPDRAGRARCDASLR